MSAPVKQFYDRAEVVAIAHARGLKHITENSVVTASYKNHKPLKLTKVNGRVYYAHSDVETWLAGDRVS
ncbi:DNA-binding protein [Mycolicibacterium frederiksbergense]|uniref:DNA-binding protein n=1 Tax=Mycolicibacterium frederiksbergense TaxID=117567 RepID=UPI00265BCAEB|nr:DNA-binding protein [Mycolicibacterium frederiksbergense]MDO0975160.1 DNA-binding protein [Mycolicibacterium frederiksbergense]